MPQVQVEYVGGPHDGAKESADVENVGQLVEPPTGPKVRPDHVQGVYIATPRRRHDERDGFDRLVAEYIAPQSGQRGQERCTTACHRGCSAYLRA